MEENWKIVEECSYYLISNMGNVKKIKNLNNMKAYDREGYVRIDLYDSRDKKYLKRSVHRLVAEAFIPNPLNKPQVNHIDGDKKNNRVENLEWCTQSENMKHAFKTGLCVPNPLKGEDRHNSKMTEEKVILLREMYDSGEFLLKELAEEFNISISVAWKIAKRNTWKHTK